MAALEIPCIRKVRRGGGDGASVQFGIGPGEDGNGAGYILISPGGSPIDIAIVPFPPFILPFPDFSVIFNDLFGKSRIQIQKDEIQKYLTQILRYVHNRYGFPLRDDRALQFKSDGVQRQLQARPDLAAEVPLMQDDADKIVTGAFGYDKSGPGIRQRMVNQFLANAAINAWPLNATMDLWVGIVAASTCVPKVIEPPPPPPPPPPLPEPEPQRPCPPGKTQAECWQLCGQVRQLTASQQPLGQYLYNNIQYFQDCILPPDGSWQYKAPVYDGTWQETFIERYAWLPEGTKVSTLPPWNWPYNWTDTNAPPQIDVVSTAPDGSRWPVGTVLVTLPGQPPDYVILPDGSVECFGDQLPPPDDEEEPPEEPPPPPTPPPPDYFVQLRSDVELLKQDYLQFKSTMLLQVDSIKRALWQSMLRSNFQAAEVWADGQPGWQGDNPPADQPSMPPGWQVLPTPGNPQVLDIPPIQRFPRTPPPPPPGPQPWEDRLRKVEECCTTFTTDFDNLLTELPGDIQQLIDRYDQEVEKPDLQKLRDECCQQTSPPENPEPSDVCQEGRDKWGIEAECWHEANGQNPYPIDEDIAARPTPAESTLDFDQAVSTQPSGVFLERRLAADNAFLAAVKGQWSRPTNSYAPKLRSWVYQNPAPEVGL